MSVEIQHFIEQIIDKDLTSGKHESIVTRFPPEPNGFLHIGHAKSICLNFGLAEKYNGKCHLRFDDTNPDKEEQTYIEAIQEDVRWLGYQWAGEIRYASAYFDRLYLLAIKLIENKLAYVCSLSADEVRDFRGTLTTPGRNSPFRDRSVEENLALFQMMKEGGCQEGEHVLRAKIDMSSPNINLRDPVIYRVKYASHHQTGDIWCIYPTYDYTHALSDAFEAITHSLCTLEFEAHRPLYDWIISQFDTLPAKPRQIEFARLNLNYTVTSKRKLKQLVDEGFIEGWDDPRMPTLAGLRRRGYTPESIRRFCEAIGVTKADGIVDMGMLEFSIRDDLDKNASRAMCVLRPLKVILTDLADDHLETLQAPRHPKQDQGQRALPFTRILYIDREDFMEEPPSKYFRLAPGKEVRLRNSYVIRCNEVIKSEQGEIIELRCTRDPDTLGKNPVGRKVKGVIHWVSAEQAVRCQVRLYDRLFEVENPEAAASAVEASTESVSDGEQDKERRFTDFINPDSLKVIDGALIEPGLGESEPDCGHYQFEREGYFAFDRASSTADQWVFNRTVTLKDSWAKLVKKTP